MTDAAPSLIDGAWVSARTPATRDIRTPATLELVGADCGPDDVGSSRP
jgi:hypothetical protein